MNLQQIEQLIDQGNNFRSNNQPGNALQCYAQAFVQMFERISLQQRTPLVPFLLKGIADAKDPSALFQADRIHPTAQAHPQILANVWPVLKTML